MKPIEPTPEPGVYHNIPFLEYCRWDAVSRSELVHLATSPAHYHWHKFEKPEPEPKPWIDLGDALELGTAIHDCILLADLFDQRYAIGPDVKLTTKEGKAEWAAFASEHPGKVLLRAPAGAVCMRIRRRVLSSRFARDLLHGDGGESEVSIVWDENGRRCKARLDRWAPNMPRGASVADLKSTRDAQPERWRLQAIREKLYMQTAWYTRGLRALGMEVPAERFYFLAYEKSEPFASSFHTFAADYVADADEAIDDLLGLLKRCEESGQWPGFGHVVHEIHRPKYDQMVEPETALLLDQPA